MRELEKWTRAYDDGGWRYKFQTSNMAESFNSVLKGIRAMPINAIVSFTFYRLVAWFNERHTQAMALQSNNQKWAPKPKKHLDNAKERVATTIWAAWTLLILHVWRFDKYVVTFW